ncbi:MAG: hypothetical protein ACE5K2_03760, partial [Candidatus Zixiibacteriota bacterium]
WKGGGIGNLFLSFEGERFRIGQTQENGFDSVGFGVQQFIVAVLSNLNTKANSQKQVFALQT